MADNKQFKTYGNKRRNIRNAQIPSTFQSRVQPDGRLLLGSPNETNSSDGPNQPIRIEQGEFSDETDNMPSSAIKIDDRKIRTQSSMEQRNHED